MPPKTTKTTTTRKTAKPRKPSPQLKLMKVLVQPVFVLDHGSHVTEIPHPVVAIPPEEWPTYSSERFPRELKEWEKKLAAELKNL